jgi:hypothetical protein
MIRLLAAALLFAVFADAAAAEPVYPQGVRIGLEPAPGLKPAAGPVFEDPEHNVMVGILDLPANTYEQVMQSVFAPQQPGMSEVKRESFAFASGIGYLFSARANEGGVIQHRYFMLAMPVVGNDRDLVALIRVVVPDSARAAYPDAAIRKMLASVTFRDIPIDEQLKLLPFQLGEFSDFRVMRVLREGGVILIDGAGDDLRHQGAIIISVGRGAPETPNDRENFAREMLTTTPLRDITVDLSEPMRLNNRPAYEIRAKAESLSGDPLNVVQWVRFGVTTYLRVIGSAPRDQWDKLFPRFRAVRDGIKF